ncbi:type II secretion system F family protein [Planococcus shenhongbingii]|uniref:Type II secretion system F family protein n=1 Tax=Planococcus shenhongbingii TaxID=3058398 RepID=A0ABT8NAM2_9BACL|nr:type II secretion system F family protein [Planococcus sp. N017]MDN7244896.1 type II secretion system F family protein [Planococcus sp. N017]
MDLSIAVLYGAAVLALLFGAYLFLDYRRNKQEWKKKLKTWYPEEKRKSAISVWGDRFDESDASQGLTRKLKSANVNLLASEYIGMHALGILMFYVVFNMIFNMAPLPSLLLTAGILAGSHFLLFYIRKNKYEDRLNGQLSEVCRLLANAARSGMTITQGIDMVAREVNEPAKDEFKRLSNELKLGVPFETALHAVQKRNDSRDFQLFIATLLIQKRTGGNLATTLETMSNTLEDRKILHQTIQTMTSEQRYISLIVPAMPIFILLFMNNIIEGFTDPLTTPIGIILMIAFGLGIILSFFLIRQITNIKV